MMQTKSQTLLESAIQHPLLIILDLMLGYAGYGFLTFPILLTFFMVVFDYLLIFGSKLPSFLDYIPSIPALSSDAPVHLTGDDVIGAYFLLTALFWGVVRLARELFSLIRQLVGKAPLPETVQPHMLPVRQLLADFARRIPRRLFWSVLPTTTVFFIAFIAMPFNDMISRDDLVWFYLILIVFCVIGVGLIVSHILFSEFSQLILVLARRHLVTGRLSDE